MDTTVGLFIAIILMAVLFFTLRWIFRARSKFGGTRIVTCPETARPAAVEVDSLHAALTSVASVTDIRLQNCSRWPIKRQCGQECLLNLNVTPAECLVSSVLMKWYRGKKCIYCGVRFGEVGWTDHKPALRSPTRDLLKWDQIPLADVPVALETYSPVCWNCYIAQSFVIEHPELVVFRPWTTDVSKNEGQRQHTRQ